MRLLFAKGIPYSLLPFADSVNHCTSKEISMEMWQSTIQKKLRKLFLIDPWEPEHRVGRRLRGPDPWAGRVLEAQSVGAVRTALPRRAVLAARFLPR